MPGLENIKGAIEATRKVPFSFLLMLPTIITIGTSGYLAYLDKTPALYIGGFLLGSCLFVLAIRQPAIRNTENLSSSEWLLRIERKLRDCGSAQIYLRKFDHPDNFKAEHRDILIKIMKTIKGKIDGGAQITIIAYHPNPNEKSGADWLRGSGTHTPNGSIIIRTSQPATNSTSIYIFDDRTCFYNKAGSDGMIYKEENFSSSILYDLINRGYSNLRENGK